MLLGSILFLGVCIPMLLIVYFTDKSVTKPSGNIILGATVPKSKMEDEELLKIIEDYKKEEKKFILIGLITALLIFVIGIKFCKFAAIYLILWTTYMVIGENVCLKKAFNKIQQLKRKNDWFTLKKRVISVDTEVSRQKNKMVISKLYFLPSLIINVIGIVFMDNLVISLSILSTALLCFVLYMFYIKRPTIVYSQETEINLACNLIYRRNWSIIWAACAFLSSLPNIGFLLNETVGVITIIIGTILIPVIILERVGKIKETQNKLLEAINDEIYVDDDEYWKGLCYNNPNDSRFMVEKRVGIGTTINLAHPAGKVFMGVTIAILSVVIISVLIMEIKLMNVNFSLNIDNNRVSIESSMYEIEFDKDDIKEISLLDEMPHTSRKNGVNDSEIALGNYNVEGYGKSRLYIKKNVNKIVVIKLKDEYIFITGDSEDDAQRYYDELTNIQIKE